MEVLHPIIDALPAYVHVALTTVLHLEIVSEKNFFYDFTYIDVIFSISKIFRLTRSSPSRSISTLLGLVTLVNVN